MNTRSLLLELLISGFFAIACFRARAVDINNVAMRPRDLLRLTGRLERLRQTRWQWFAMVLIIIFVRLEMGLPLVVELTAALQFIIFLALPAQAPSHQTVKKIGRKSIGTITPEKIRSARAR
ncbi:MAG TPA: hypothetical protein VHY48_10365 [Acidobacteriaceae bacterium]|jgi:hypothetical protein|nr:hypothetical protein [Acidobacteriaceae bacterium]